MKQKPRWTLEMLTASLAVLCGLLVLVLLVQRPTAWPALLALVVLAAVIVLRKNATVKSLDSRMKAAGAASLSAIDVTDSERQDAQRAAELGITAGTADDDLRAMVPQTTPELRPVMPMLPRWVIFFLLPIIATIALNIEFSRGTTVAREIKRIRRHRKAQSAFESDPRAFL